jgi:glutathione S-transferase
VQVVPHTRSPDAVSAAGQEFVQHLRHLDQQLLLPGDRLAVGNCLSLADCAYPGLLHYAGLLWPVLGLEQLDFVGMGLPRVAAWHAALCQEPAVVAVLEELAPAAHQWLDSKLN